MQNQSSNNTIKLVAVFVVVLVGAWVGFTLYRNAQFRIVSSNPASNKITTVTPFFNLTFNRNLDGKSASVTSNPNIINSYNVAGKSLNINLTNTLKGGTKYTITIKHISDTGGKQLNNLTITFTPAVSTDNPPADQEKVLLQQQTQSTQNVTGDPLVQQLPYAGAGSEFYIDYTVDGSSGEPKPIIIITAPTQQGQQDAITWIQSLNIDPSKYQIQYKTGPVNY